MQKMFTSVGSSDMPGIQQLNLVTKTSSKSQSFINQAASMLTMAGTPGDQDIRGFLTPALQPYQTIQQGQNNQVVGNIAYKSNQSPFSEGPKMRKQGLFAKRGFVTQPPLDFNLPVFPPPITGLDDPVVYNLLTQTIQKDYDYVKPIVDKIKAAYQTTSQVNAVQPSNMGNGLVRIALNTR